MSDRALGVFAGFLYCVFLMAVVVATTTLGVALARYAVWLWGKCG